MTPQTLLKIEIKYENDVVLARQRARQLAEQLGFDQQDQIRIATALSEVARNAFQYADGGRVEFSVRENENKRPQFFITVSDSGPGIRNLAAVLNGSYVSETGMGVGLSGARRLMDECRIESNPEGTCVWLIKNMRGEMKAITPAQIAAIADKLARQNAVSPYEEMQRQNQELVTALSELQTQRAQLAEMNQELEETNRGVVALYAELDERADYLKRASELKTEFLSNMTHEFRTPLNSIISISQMVMDRLDGELTPEQEKQVTFIQKAARDLTVLVNDLLDLAKVEAGKMLVRPARFSINEMFGTLRGMLKPLLEHNTSLSLVFEEPDKDIPEMESDEGKVSQILRNFISNGLKYTERGEVRVCVRPGKQGMLVFSVSDTGIGIAKADLGRIFEEYMQVEGTHQKKVRGTGLGLPLAKKLANLLGGDVFVESREGIGSVFSLTLPIRYVTDNLADHEPMPAPENLVKILVIDDNEADRYVIRRLAARPGIELLEADSGATGIELACTARPHYIVLDLSLPDATGFEILQSLKDHEESKEIPVVIHSSMVLRPDEERFLADKAALVISKDPSQTDSFRTLLEKMFAGLPIGETNTDQNMYKDTRHA